MNNISYYDLYESVQKCKLGKIRKYSVARYYLNTISETHKLYDELENGTYKPKKPYKFLLTSPKPREIISIAFRDRVYQRTINDAIVYPAMTRGLIYDNAACQTGKGTDFARGRLKEFLHRMYRKNGTDFYVLQCDIKGYYPNMRHDLTFEHLGKHLDNDTCKSVTSILQYQYAGDVGFNAGSQLVQICGISVLSELDHIIKEKLHIKCYTTVMDDRILLHESRAYLEYCKSYITAYLNERGFAVNPKKTNVYPVSDGILYLGFIFRVTKTGKVIMTVNPKKIKAERRRLKRMIAKYKRDEITLRSVTDHRKSFRAHCEHGNSFKVLQRLDGYYKRTHGRRAKCESIKTIQNRKEKMTT